MAHRLFSKNATRKKSGAFVQGSFRGNGVFIGLPVIIYASNALSANAEKLASIMIARL